MNSFRSLFCEENALSPLPQHGSNSSPPAQLSTDHFSPLEGMMGGTAAKPLCALSSV